MPEQTSVNVLQDRLNARAAKRLDIEVNESLAPVENLRNMLPGGDRMTFKKSSSVTFKDDGTVSIEMYHLIEELRRHFNSTLAERYQRKETEEFLKQVDHVTNLVGSQEE